MSSLLKKKNLIISFDIAINLVEINSIDDIHCKVTKFMMKLNCQGRIDQDYSKTKSSVMFQIAVDLFFLRQECWLRTPVRMPSLHPERS